MTRYDAPADQQPPSEPPIFGRPPDVHGKPEPTPRSPVTYGQAEPAPRTPETHGEAEPAPRTVGTYGEAEPAASTPTDNGRRDRPPYLAVGYGQPDAAPRDPDPLWEDDPSAPRYQNPSRYEPSARTWLQAGPSQDDATALLPRITDPPPTTPDDAATTLIPRVADETAVIDRVGSDDTAVIDRVRSDETAVIQRIRSDETDPADATSPDAPSPDPSRREHRPAKWGDPGDDARSRSRRAHARHRALPQVILNAARGIGETMITLGLILLLFSAYEIWGKAAIVNDHQADLDSQLTQEWGDPTIGGTTGGGSGPELAPPPGWAIARLFIPKLGKHWVVVEGVQPKNIAYAPGHYPQSAKPGQIGNFAVAGHRSPAIFWDLDKMRPGDVIVVETRSNYYIYRVTQTRIVNPTAVEVVAPVPGHIGAKPTTAMLTLTTCDPKWDNYHRLIVHARLDRSQPRSAGVPAEISGG